MTPMTELADEIELRLNLWSQARERFHHRAAESQAGCLAEAMKDNLPAILAALRPQPEPEDRVERVARAIYDSMFAPHERCWGEDPRLRERYMDTARAALRAAQEPTPDRAQEQEGGEG